MNHKNVIILSEPRSGSSHLMRFLNKIGFKTPNILSGEFKRDKNPVCDKVNHFFSSRIKRWNACKLIHNEITKDMIQKVEEFNPFYVFLERNDFTSQVISFYYAQKTNSWMKNNNTQDTLTIDFEILKNILGYYHKVRIKKEENMKLLPDSLKVTFNEIITLDGKKKVLNYFNIEWCDFFNTLLTNDKITTKNYEDIFTNYNEAVEFISSWTSPI